MRHRPQPTEVPIGAEWLNNMPVGDGWFPNQPQQPVVELQYRVGPGLAQNVVEYLYAAIQRGHLREGVAQTRPNNDVTQWVQTQVGRRNDQARHIIGVNEGGLGTVNWNIFPQSKDFNMSTDSHGIEYVNMGADSRDIESVLHDTVKKHGTAKIWFRFVYGNAREPYCPTSFNYFVLHHNGSTTHNDLINP